MIEIALDKNNNDSFRNLPRTVYTIRQFSGSNIDSYLQLAQKIISHHASEQIIIIRIKTAKCSLNMLAVALFIESCRLENQLECVVFKVTDYERAINEYKPFVALTIAIRLAMRLCRENAETVYRELENMQYLGLDIHTDYKNNKIFSTLPGNGTPLIITTHTTSEAIATAATLKALSLAKADAAVNAEIDINKQDFAIDENDIIRRVIDNVHPWIH